MTTLQTNPALAWCLHCTVGKITKECLPACPPPTCTHNYPFILSLCRCLLASLYANRADGAREDYIQNNHNKSDTLICSCFLEKGNRHNHTTPKSSPSKACLLSLPSGEREKEKKTKNKKYCVSERVSGVGTAKLQSNKAHFASANGDT